MSIRKVVPIEQAEWRLEPAPVWFEAREPEWSFEPPEGYAACFLLLDEQHQVATRTVTYRSIRRALTHAAVQAFGQAALDFDPAADRLLLHEMAIWRPNTEGCWEKLFRVQREGILLRQREQGLEQQMLNGRLSLVALLEDLRVGDAVELFWTIEPRDHLPGLRFLVFHAFFWAVPVARASIVIHRREGEALMWRVHQREESSSPHEEISATRLCWEVRNPPVVQFEPNAPNGHWPGPVLDVTSWERWEEVATFVAELWAEALGQGGGAVAEEAARLRAGSDAPREAIRFVQEQVRYLAVDFGHGGGMLPNGADSVLRRRFGDCKDKAVLLTALLRALGIEAWPLLVAPNWRAAVARVQPSTAAFSHAIVTFLMDGQRHFVDPTIVGQGGDLAHLQVPPYGFGLEVRTGATELLELPPRPPAELTLTEVFHLDRKGRNGFIEQTLHATAWLADDLRSLLVRDGTGAFFKTRAEALQSHFPALAPSGEAGQVQDEPNLNSLEVRARYQLRTWGPIATKPPPFFRYGAHGLFLAIESGQAPEQRRQPWALRHPILVHHRVVVRGRTVRRTKAERHRVMGPGFRYECDVKSKWHEVAFDYRWQSTAGEIPPEQWVHYRRERERALARAGASVRVGTIARTPQFLIFLASIVIVSTAGLLTDSHEPVPAALTSPGWDRISHAPPARVPSAAYNQLQQVREAMRNNDYAKALTLLEQQSARVTQSVEYQCLRAETLLRFGRIEEALAAVKRAGELNASSSLPHVVLAIIQEKQADFRGARTTLESALKRWPSDSSVLIALGRLVERMGDTGAAWRAWEKVLALWPAEPEALQHRSLILWRSGEAERADREFLAVVDAQPIRSASLEEKLSEYYYISNRPEMAVLHARRALDAAPNDLIYLHGLAQSLLQNSDASGALETCHQMVELYPTAPLGWADLAAAQTAVNDRAGAVETFQKWISLAPSNPLPRLQFATLLQGNGEVSEARSVLEKAALDLPKEGEVWRNYAGLLEKLNDPLAAEARLKAQALLPTPLPR